MHSLLGRNELLIYIIKNWNKLFKVWCNKIWKPIFQIILKSYNVCRIDWENFITINKIHKNSWKWKIITFGTENTVIVIYRSALALWFRYTARGLHSLYIYIYVVQIQKEEQFPLNIFFLSRWYSWNCDPLKHADMSFILFSHMLILSLVGRSSSSSFNYIAWEHGILSQLYSIYVWMT